MPKITTFLTLLLTFIFTSWGGCAMTTNTVETVLNGLHITVDAETGGILRMSYEGLGTMAECSPESAGGIDLAYPVPQFEALRLASRFSRGAQVTRTDDALVIYWNKLSASRDRFPITGDVSATVRMVASPDGKSVIMTCRVANQSQNPVRQVLFPDFGGILPFAGADKTAFRCAQFASLPFQELQPNEGKLSLQYMTDLASYAAHYKAGGIFSNMAARWFDFGSLRGGFSIFPKRWGWDPQVDVRLQLSEVENKIRLMCLHDVTIKPGESWESGEFVLTPHTGGWATGIEPYREWVQKHYKREYPVPEHVLEGLGYRTVWMCQNVPDDPEDAIFRFTDLPKLAKECKAHGIDEMVLWAWVKGFVLPLPAPYPHIGTEKEMADAIAECRKIGVNVAPFISVLQANPETAPRYGAKVTDNNGWTYHTELVPRWNPPYATGFSCVQIGPLNPKWHEDVLNAAKHLVDIGIHSLSWDQYWTTADPPPNMNTLSQQIRAYAKQRDPESTFSGEELWNFEVDSAYLDYTWNWGGYRDIRPLTSVFPSPRVNCCISASSQMVKQAFADNMYLNLMPRKKDSVNGSDYIANYPEMSRALKQCAALRKQFLTYFTDGKLIGECILSEERPGAHVSAYVLPDRALIVLLNQGGQGPIDLKCALGRWIRSASGKYAVKCFDMDGKLVAEFQVNSDCLLTTPSLRAEEMVVFEVKGNDG